MNRVTGALLALALTAAPVVAEACPSCAGRDRGTTAILLMLGGMILFPFLVARIVLRVIRAGEAQAPRTSER